MYVWLSAYALSILLANVFLDWFIPLPFYGLLSLGTIFFAAVFTVRDKLHKYGLKIVFLGIFSALLITSTYSIYYTVPYQFIIASFLSILISELVDTVIFERLKTHSWTIKVLSSNALSVPIDSILFTLLAFTGVMSYPEMIEIIYADIIIKFTIAALIAALIVWKPTCTKYIFTQKSSKYG
jgi:uncharacterized PurR-regulated membrane protein YhhQ (DUF165 family)